MGRGRVDYILTHPSKRFGFVASCLLVIISNYTGHRVIDTFTPLPNNPIPAPDIRTRNHRRVPAHAMMSSTRTLGALIYGRESQSDFLRFASATSSSLIIADSLSTRGGWE